ncbi:hypothetical protein AU252_00895 [Pseudarthrobacter sulfonivorans]|uniref:ABC transporter domain-containing protein n=1 Tax=Pseudarthrobacter sulfonivorans TaxID=121292 RepID=A0A0U3PCD3_9MICC|nr:ATP-binding cassette domain-containing protein [Pseudarthrobacter sulfonivorans]ALV39896.1 hypothetical protein AU252_00895 [Pseudarthrobacter sulfonivorans]
MSDTIQLRARGVSVNFGGNVAVEGIDLDVDSGQIIAVIGPNGAGKSTLINALTGFVPLSSGSIELQSRGSVTDLTRLPSRRRVSVGISRTFQTPRLVPELTVAENVCLGSLWQLVYKRWFEAFGGPAQQKGSRDRFARACEALEEVGVRASPGTPASSLSLGEQRLVEVARVIYSGSAIALLDEPFAGLSAVEQEVLAVEIARLRDSGTAVLLVEHQLDQVRALADRVLAMDMGRPLLEGTSYEVLGASVVRERYLGE